MLRYAAKPAAVGRAPVATSGGRYSQRKATSRADSTRSKRASLSLLLGSGLRFGGVGVGGGIGAGPGGNGGKGGGGVGLTSIFAGVGDQWSRCPGQRIGGFGPAKPSDESDAIEAFTSAMNKDSEDRKNQPLELRATGMGGKYAGKILPYGPVK